MIVESQCDQKIDRSPYCPPVAQVQLALLAEEQPAPALSESDPASSESDPILSSLSALFKVRKRVDKTETQPTFVADSPNKRRFRISSSGVDLEGNIISKQVY